MVTAVRYRKNHASPWRKNYLHNYKDSTVRSENLASYMRTVLDDTDTMKIDELTSTDKEYCSNVLLSYTGRESCWMQYMTKCKW
jgi:hypothetical protein